MSILDELITDRTVADVSRWAALKAKGWSGMTPEEKSEWSSGMKGSYNAADLNRVQEAMHYLADRFAIYGYAVSLHDIREWTEADIPAQSDMDAYLEDLAALRGVLEMAETTPDAPESMNFLTYVEANDIEQILVDINAIMNQVFMAYARSNAFTFWSGNRPLPCAESNLGRTWVELDAMETTWANWQVADWYLLLYGNLEAEGVVS